LVEQANAGPVEEQDLERIPALAEEHEQRAAARIEGEPLRDDARQAVKAPAQVDRIEADEHLDAVRDHARPPISVSTSATVPASAPAPIVIRVVPRSTTTVPSRSGGAVG